MPENKVYEYAVIRVVPLVHREEFMNVGVILFCKELKYLGVEISLNEKKLSCFSSELDLSEIEAYLRAMKSIAKGNKSTIGQLSLPERFRWLSATRSSVIQCSKIHPGLSRNPEETLKRIFEEMVL